MGSDVAAIDLPPTMVVGVHRHADETLRLHEYSPPFDPERFTAHERFFVDKIPRWVRTRFGVGLPAEHTAVLGVSASGELALALGLRHPRTFGSVLCASPGAGYGPPEQMPTPLPRTYLVAGQQEPFFLENATRWATALRDSGAEVVMKNARGRTATASGGRSSRSWWRGRPDAEALEPARPAPLPFPLMPS